VEGAQIARRREERLPGRGAENDQIFEDPAGSIRLDARHGLGIAAQTLPQIHQAVLTEAQDGFPGARVDLFDEEVDLENEPPVLAIFALPVVYAASRNAAQVLVNPDLFAGGGVESHQRI